MSAREERQARATVDCTECCARAGDPCVSVRRNERELLRPIRHVHTARILGYRAGQFATGVKVIDLMAALKESLRDTPPTSPAPLPISDNQLTLSPSHVPLS